MGYKTYEVCLGFGEWHYQGKTTYVFSRDASEAACPKPNSSPKTPWHSYGA
jgi:dihydrofolate reductase